ncbi:hypothetical protein B0A58_06630 [Flavobacterium branchiophilum NBRC 15030 = ATCC 35035]|uniref:Uncharacterized protein n=1 Tax=Flavobacterium branchiophilum TaxID=55197 RepID=A0A543G805_9FLAO|nr:hypothetical protein [Flavobacterium branchiophilum]OXA76929.1 hypothetical protein B0A58_06630 [Flavobacterium branchiophilum NBRC 15030 = ATCC 35035]TQM42211.1 hypothetical protein BC670_3250 [Flavobacterium branchiophilum]GEM54493.1 hypothetical protein FB1_07140 [Flavobacterium branchiophilum NBRC 15030 = ATCC 35035]
MKPFKPSAKAFKHTFCVFEEVPTSTITHIKPDFISLSGSQYFYHSDGMFRLSNHWGRLANSKWRLINKGFSDGKFKLGFAKWEAFFEDNDHDKLYYLELDIDQNDIHYQHKNNSNYDGKAILRTSFETAKRLKQARNIWTLTNWFKHFEHFELEDLRIKIVQDLIYTNKTLEAIKRHYIT